MRSILSPHVQLVSYSYSASSRAKAKAFITRLFFNGKTHENWEERKESQGLSADCQVV